MGKIRLKNKPVVSRFGKASKRVPKTTYTVVRQVGRTGLSVTKKVPKTKTYQKSKSIAKNSTKKIAKITVVSAKTATHHSKKVAKSTHKAVAVKPHNYLTQKSKKYKKWHEWRWHPHVHYSVLLMYLAVIGFMIYSTTRFVFAADILDTWNFTNPGDFTFDSSKVETDGITARLKAQSYSADASTVALFNLNETSGNTADDTSSNNNDASTTGSPSWSAGNLGNGLTLNGTSQYASAPDSPSLSLTGNNTFESWTKLASPFSAGSSQYRQTILDKGSYQLYYDNETGKVTYELENNGANSWTQQAGYDMLNNNGAKINKSWDQNSKQIPYATVKMGSNIYTALGGGTNDAEIWKYDIGAGTWEQIAGDGINSSWNNEVSTNAYEAVLSLATDGTDTLYAGLGTGTNDGDVWRFQSGTWVKIGGDALNNGWAGNSFNGVYSLAVDGSTVYAGLGYGTNMGQVWVCTDCETTPNWNGSRVGGFSGTARGWGAGFEEVRAMTLIGGNPVVGLGASAGDGQVWRCTANCSTPGSANWVMLGGTNAGSWTNAEEVLTLAAEGNTLYVGTGITANADANVRTCDVSATCSNTAGWTLLGSSAQWGSTKLGVYSIDHNGSTLYVGVGSNGAGDDEVWRYDGAWTKVGGDNLNSGWNNTHTYARSVLVDGTTVFAGLQNGAEVYSWKCTNCSTSPNWGGNRIGGKYVNKSWGQSGFDSVESSTTVDGKLYVGTGNNTASDATVWEQDPNSGQWSMIGGQGINSSWPIDTYEAVWSMTNYKNKLYVGLGSSANDAEIWRYDNPGWTKVGGDGTGGSWSASYEAVMSMGVANGKLYAGLGLSGGDGEVWECGSCDGGSPAWTQIGGTASGNWGVSSYSSVSAFATYRGSLYATLGNSSAGLAEVWRYGGSGTTWTKVGGDGQNSSWANSVYEDAPNLVVWNDKLVASLGTSGVGAPNNDAEVWACTDCDGGAPTWAKIGGDGNGNDSLGWPDAGNYDRIKSMATYNGDLYAGLGLSTGDGEVWKFNGTNWTQVGGDGINSGWLDSYIEDITTMVVHRGKLYVSMGNTANSDAMVWSYGDNGYLQSSTTTQDTNWHHIAARYNGSVMELFIDGTNVGSTNKTLTMPDNDKALLLGKSYGGFDNGRSQGFFNGSLDEVRISNINRASFTTKPYTADPQTINLTNAVRKSGVLNWDTFISTENPNGGSINYRLSDDEGTTWKYWNGSAWVTSNSTGESNPASVINSNLSSFPVTFNGITWQAVLDGNGDQQVSLDQVQLGHNQDVTAPTSNASSIQAYKSNGGASIGSGAWTNSPSPYFTWTAGTDAGSGIKGYCLYLGTDGSGDPVTTKGLLGTSPGNPGGSCQFMISSNSIDLSTAGFINTALTTSNDSYYLNIKAIDNSGNIFGSNAQFNFKFDNTPPSNPGFISAPSGFINTKTANLSWPTSGGQEAQDSNSGLAGLQYKINGTSWYGDTHNGSGDMSDLLNNDGSYTTQDPPDFNNIIEGTNTVFFRTWDQAGNVTSTYVSAALKINTNGAPSEPQNLDVNPDTNTTNAFAFNWDAPTSFVGDENNLTYCYAINTVPTVSNCTFTSPGVTSLGSGPYATQPGSNTFYVVAKDESNNINYDNYSSITFSANTPSPGMPLNTDIVDVSIKSTNNWRLALTWDEPNDVGAGVSNYKVYRSTDNISFNSIGSSSSTTYIDSGLTQQTYYYKVKACDSTNNCGAYGSGVSMLPTGKFTSPASLTSEPSTREITTKKATISWSTDRGSDSKIAIGTSSSNYSPSEVGNSNQVTSHEINLDNLAAGTTYYYITKWTDEDGNTGQSQEHSFTTSPAPILKEVTTTATTLSSANIEFKSKQAVRVEIYYGKSESFGGVKSVNTSLAESSYSFNLSGLEDGSKYYYMLSAFDEEGNQYKGNIFSFSTPPRPKISNLRFQPVEGEPTSTQSVTWETNVPTSSQLTYGLTNSPGIEVSESSSKTTHKIIIKNLQDDSEYYLIAQGRDKDGNLSSSDRQVFRTALDTRSPIVSNISVEVSIKGTGAEARGQVIVSWITDEPSTSQVGYAEGSDATVFNNKSALDESLTTEHLVIVSDLPTSKLYSIKPLSKDKANNEGSGETQSAIVGKASDSVLTIILSTLQKIFGF
jgi:hypothetical protein